VNNQRLCESATEKVQTNSVVLFFSLTMSRFHGIVGMSALEILNGPTFRELVQKIEDKSITKNEVDFLSHSFNLLHIRIQALETELLQNKSLQAIHDERQEAQETNAQQVHKLFPFLFNC
jgi:hypothetical protein